MVSPADPPRCPHHPRRYVGSFSVPALDAALPDLPLDEFVRYAERQIVPILPDSPPRFVNLNQYLWSERWLERYQEMDFIQRVLNGMASRRPRLEALRDSPAGSGYPLRPSGDAVLALLSADDAPGRKQTAVIATSLIGKSWLNDC